MIDFHGMSLWASGLVFAAAAAIVWSAGTRIARYADQIAERTGLGRAFLGMILLGGITSLPEVAVSTTAAYGGNAELAVNNLLGGLTMQVAILAIADAAIGRDALTSVVAQPIVLLLGALNIVLLSIVSVAVIVGDVPLFGVGAWSSLIGLLYVFGVRLAATHPKRRTWAVADAPRNGNREEGDRTSEDEAFSGDDRSDSLRTLLIKTCIAGAIILVAGFLLSRTGEAIAHKTGLGSSFVGAVLVAISTSLPEISTVLSAVRLRRYEMAISDILGTNLFDAGLIFVVDVVYRGGPVLNEVGKFSAVAALLGTIVTALFVAGLVERRDRTFLRMGIDSLAVLIVYVGGIALLYSLR